MKYRKFGKTDLEVSEIGFGAWGIGGPTMVGEVPIGWGEVNDTTSIYALNKAFDRGINFFDTADFYGLEHSEELIGKVFGNSGKVIIATKGGHVISDDKKPAVDYSKKRIIKACEESLIRLKRDQIDYYQLHSARLEHFLQGDCIEAMHELEAMGKIRYWGVSLNTFNPFPEAEYLFTNNLGHGIQIVLNLINQKAAILAKEASEKGFGVIARMPVQFGLLTGKFTVETTFRENDHRRFRLTPEILVKAIEDLKPVWQIQEAYGISKTEFALSFILSLKGVSTVIPGIKTPEQAIMNTQNLIRIKAEHMEILADLYDKSLRYLLDMMERQG